ncbi:LysE/ArgO family amino acid transporter [Mannheimia haemolytica]|uniref:LysE/ArgO family amino acid transporter n=1 Tax=Mannheimia haemolytica TaxID=75985 RepID=UPI000385FF03|nr:LysE/ArgO family amino acid transporter [Mannheimia haemolytica]EPZ01170.1 LysE family transporter [Mannheimia haemolytica D35]MDW1150013.1 LysE/ArgO family amino acid transporter [Mannheimia haemolytica]MDW1160224.1 LysE/ArgO family amino acid transporter [Mannheimia haemolytica]NBB67607.1 LysE family transporter [Mannheimia haemolytica]TRC48778.1 amino acid transporter [Mannheimia haemolytica]
MDIFIQGFIVCFGLIVSIGAQNAFLLKQGILKQHIFWIALLCFLGDVFLMTIGVLGLGTLIAELPVVSFIISLLGAIFLLSYGSRSFISVFKSGEYLVASGENATSLKKALLITFAITFLNPHVYIDTVVIVGSIGGKLDCNGKIYFLAGALLCSFIWFFGIGYGASLLSPYFAKRRTWQILDAVTGLIMYFIAFSLLIYTYQLALQIF